MRWFKVIVSALSVRVVEMAIPLKLIDVSATVDGESFVYRIVINKKTTYRSNWRERGYTHALEHAKSAGIFVTFHRVYQRRKRKLRATHKANKRLFE